MASFNEVFRKYGEYPRIAGESKDGVPIVHNHKDMFQYLEKFDGDIDMTLDEFEKKWKLGNYSELYSGE